MLIILESMGGGDIDVYCTPADGLLGLMKPSPSFSVWKSEHGAGHDHVFIGRRDSFYSTAWLDLQVQQLVRGRALSARIRTRMALEWICPETSRGMSASRQQLACEGS